ncbi:MAG: hypothetical protein HY044_00375 [Candidatus Woesebacteria bacterium]|nr:MAG: hypothetical protein HY044_00375 [Candidatus Woesebacteria bacterium]
MGKNKPYLINDGILYELGGVVLKETEGGFRIEANVDGSQYRFEDVLTAIRLNAINDFFLPTFSGGRIVAIRKSSNWKRVMIEFEPSIRNIKLGSSLFGVSSLVWVAKPLAFPYVVFVVQEDSCGDVSAAVYYRNQAIGSYNDPLFYANLPNNHGKRLCMNFSEASRQRTLIGKLGQAVDIFWNSIYNSDLDDLLEGNMHSARNHPKNFGDWVRKSRKKSWRRFITSIGWFPADLTVTEALDRNIGG